MAGAPELDPVGPGRDAVEGIAVRSKIAQRTQQLLVAQLELSDHDFDSVVRLIQSDFGVTLTSFFADEPKDDRAD